MIFQTRVLKRMFGLKRNGVAGGWIKLHNKDFLNLLAKYNWDNEV
jgi:hypothetical protein